VIFHIKNLAQNKITKQIIKTIILIGIIIYLYLEIDFANLFNSLSFTSNFFYYILAILLCRSIIAYLLLIRWQLLLNLFSDINFSKNELSGPVFYSILANEIFVFGFLSRSVVMLLKNIKFDKIISSLMIEKFLSFYSILIFSSISLIPFYQNSYVFAFIQPLYFYVLFIFLILIIILPPLCIRSLKSSWLFNFIFNLPIIKIFKNYLDINLLLLPLLISFFIQIINLICLIIIPILLGIELILFDYILFLPIVVLISAIPVSISEWGYREFIFVILLPSIGLTSEESFSISVVTGLLYLLSSIMVVIFYELYKKFKYS